MSDTLSDAAFFSPEVGAGADWEYRFCEGAAGHILQEAAAAESTTVSAAGAVSPVWVAAYRPVPASAG